MMRRLLDILYLLFGLGGKTEAGKRAEALGLCDFSGQGRGKGAGK